MSYISTNGEYLPFINSHDDYLDYQAELKRGEESRAKAEKIKQLIQLSKSNDPADILHVKELAQEAGFAVHDVDLKNLTFWQALNNKFTGNYDYMKNLALQEQAQAFNAEEAQKQRSYEERLANNAYQRQVADLSAAGYNPAMALGAGGASTPSGATASSGAGHYTDNTKGFEFLLNALIAGISLGVKSASSASMIALNQAKTQLNTMRGFTEDSRDQWYKSATHLNWRKATSR